MNHNENNAHSESPDPKYTHYSSEKRKLMNEGLSSQS